MKDNVNNFKNYGYCILKNAISSELRDFITQYALFDEMQDFAGNDQQVPDAHSKYSDPVMETMLLHLLPVMEENTGLKLYPTYSYYRVYRDGDSLEKHIDRNSCEISATLCFNFNYNIEQYMWPIFMDGNKVEQNPGDLVIYKGCELTHWRDTFLSPSKDSWQVQGFFHFVDANGKNAEWKYDKRIGIGEIGPKEIARKKNKSSHKSYIQYL
jgi:hypothetical protein